MIQLTGAQKRYGPKILFENADWLVTPNERAGIVGANGTGKSSLLKVLAGIEGLDLGTMSVQKGVTVGYLPQEGLSLSGRSVFAECMTVFAGLRALEKDIGIVISPWSQTGWQYLLWRLSPQLYFGIFRFLWKKGFIHKMFGIEP